jgi:hypothetical protein
MSFYVVPDYVYDHIQRRLDAVISEHPDAEKDREHLYRQLLEVFNETGQIPEFTLKRTSAP